MSEPLKWLQTLGVMTEDRNTALFARQCFAWFRSDRLTPVDPGAKHWLFCQTQHKTPLGVPSLKSRWARELLNEIEEHNVG